MTLKNMFYKKTLFWGLFCVILLSFATVWRRPAENNIINLHDSIKWNDKISYAVNKENLLVSSNDTYVTKGVYNEQDGKSVHTKDVEQVKNDGSIETLKKKYPQTSSLIRHSSSVYEKMNYLLTSWIASEFFHGTDLHKTLAGHSKKTSKSKMKKYMIKYKANQRKIAMSMKKENHRLNIGDNTSSNKARNILIVTRARSGSSFLGDLLNRYPGTFYNFEPLYFCKGECNIKQVLKCEPHNEYFKHVKEFMDQETCTMQNNSAPFLFKNVRLWNACERLLSNKMKCFLPEIFYLMCPIFPIRLTKTIRLPFKETEPLLMDPDIGKSLKVIYLFRDPRGISKSLMSLCGSSHSKEWVHTCGDEAMQIRCQASMVDALDALQLKKKYPGKILNYLLFYRKSNALSHLIY